MDIPRPPAASRPTRKRQKAGRLKQLDASVIRDARARRLEALENDNYAQQREAEMLQGEDEYRPGLNSDEEIAVKKRKSKKRRVRRSRAGNGNAVSEVTGIARFNKSVATVLEEEDGMQLPPGMVALSSIVARPSRSAERRFCSICGYQSKYTCLTCAARYCSIPCDQVHQETRCLKFMA